MAYPTTNGTCYMGIGHQTQSDCPRGIVHRRVKSGMVTGQARN